ncbi:hypothetical protein WME89_07555 [Sorangium sp. So ce321]|uniref:hypothetical protein n=1 Tax=Sorangium sp. So ce321 TaxID=3133300 RepID=UPI003F5EE101
MWKEKIATATGMQTKARGDPDPTHIEVAAATPVTLDGKVCRSGNSCHRAMAWLAMPPPRPSAAEAAATAAGASRDLAELRPTGGTSVALYESVRDHCLIYRTRRCC